MLTAAELFLTDKGANIVPLQTSEVTKMFNGSLARREGTPEACAISRTPLHRFLQEKFRLPITILVDDWEPDSPPHKLWRGHN